ncbi:amino acid permease-domain-containing protein [Mycena haematopus]|nr:amino acid permease-domain-containing protein [Mycena haematopus]
MWVLDRDFIVPVVPHAQLSSLRFDTQLRGLSQNGFLRNELTPSQLRCTIHTEYDTLENEKIYWRNPGPMVSFLEAGATGRFLGLLMAIVPAAFSMGGIELVAIQLTRVKLPKATTGGESPWVLAFMRAGVKGLPSFINAVILTSAFSAGNSLLFGASRILYGLALKKQAPAFFLRQTRSGLPLPAILFTVSVFSLLAFLNLAEGPGKVFSWFVTLYYGMKRQSIRPEGIYRSRLQPFAAMWALFCGIPVFWAFNGSDFVAAYINIPLFWALYLGWKIAKKTKIASEQMLICCVRVFQPWPIQTTRRHQWKPRRIFSADSSDWDRDSNSSSSVNDDQIPA